MPFVLFKSRANGLNLVHRRADGNIGGSSWTRLVKGKSGNFGGARRVRTADLLHAMQALSQLSYGP